MDIELAKTIPIAEILDRVEINPAKENDTDAYYLSPWRNERTPSFHVNKDKNVWYDHGEGVGGNAWGLVIELLKRSGYGYTADDGLRWIRNCNLDPALPKPRDPVKGKKSKWELVSVNPLTNTLLVDYLNSRGIDVELAKTYVKEIRVRKVSGATKIFALGFENEDGGFEMRNKFFKSAVAPKTISFIQANKLKPSEEGKASRVMIFEGFMDFLTYLTIKNGILNCDVIVLNSIACVDHAWRYIKNYGYSIVYSWLHNDRAGEKARVRLDEFINSEPGLMHKPLNDRHAPHKDLNEWHMQRLKLAPIN